jgi:hypothetical protein
MATPVGDSYSAGSGVTIYGGRFGPPAWLPSLGTVADISLNTPLAAAGVPYATTMAGFARSWGGMAFAPWWGKYGRAVTGAGGHGDGAQNWLLGLDLETQLFYMERPSCTVFHATSDNYVGDPVTGWMWADTGGVNLQVGEPFTSHFYAFQIALPPSSLAGASNGWLFTPGRGSIAEGGQKSTGQSHKYALGSGGAWSMHGAPLLRGPAHGPSIYDSKRNRVLHFGDSQGSAQQVFPCIDIATQATGSITTGYIYGFYQMGGYHSAADCYVMARYAANVLTFNVEDAVTNAMTTPTPTGTPPTESAEGAWDWVDAWNAWVYYPGDGSNNIYTLKCAGDPRGNSWVWGKQTVSGTARSRFFDTNGGGLPYNRLRFVPGLSAAGKGAILWIPDYNIPAQIFHISAP